MHDLWELKANKNYVLTDLSRVAESYSLSQPNPKTGQDLIRSANPVSHSNLAKMVPSHLIVLCNCQTRRQEFADGD